MRVVKPQVEFWGEVPTDCTGSLAWIEKAGRVCYKSEDKISPESAVPFVTKLIRAGHLAMVEHSNFVVRAPLRDAEAYPEAINVLTNTPVGKFLTAGSDDQYFYVGGNLTAWAKACDGGVLFSPFLNIYGAFFGLIPRAPQVYSVCPHPEIPAELRRYTLKFICDRGVSHELVRHRPCSFAQESTRYCNYSGDHMEFVEPWWYAETSDTAASSVWTDAMLCAEEAYAELTGLNKSPQFARAVLPNSLKTEVVVTADSAEWRHIRSLRTEKAAHPDMQRIMNMVPWEKIV